MKPRPTALAVVPVLLALAAAGCGEKEEPPTTGPVVAQTTGQTTTPGGNGGNGGQQASDQQLIRMTVAEFLTKPSPAVCDELVTPRFLKQAYGNRQGCVASRKPGALANGAAVLAVKPGPGEAMIVTAKPQGGVFGGQTLKVTVVKAGNAWKIDEISGDAKVGP